MAGLVYTMLAISIFTCVACGGGASSPVQPSPNPSPTPSPTPTAPLQPTLSSIRTQVFQVWCSACHTTAGRAPEAGLSLDANVAYQSLVNVQSAFKPGAIRVVPGDPGASYLIQKLEGRSDIFGSRMPLGGPFVPQADIDVIRSWIAQGALNN